MALMLTGLMLLSSCRQKTKTAEEGQIDTLLERVENLKRLLSAEYLDSIYRYHDEMMANARLLEEDSFAGMGGEKFPERQQAYMDAYLVLNDCLNDCPALQKEISFIDSELGILKKEWLEQQIGSREFNTRFAAEVELMDGITERIYRGHDTALEQVLVHKQYRSLFDSLLAEWQKAGIISPVE